MEYRKNDIVTVEIVDCGTENCTVSDFGKKRFTVDPTPMEVQIF